MIESRLFWVAPDSRLPREMLKKVDGFDHQNSKLYETPNILEQNPHQVNHRKYSRVLSQKKPFPEYCQQRFQNF